MFAPGPAAAAAIVEATKAFGVIVQLEAEAFGGLLARMEAPLVVTAQSGRFKAKHEYLTSYKGLTFYTKSDAPLSLPEGTEVVRAKKIGVPG